MAKDGSAAERLRGQTADGVVTLSAVAAAVVELHEKLDGLRRFVFASAPRKKAP